MHCLTPRFAMRCATLLPALLFFALAPPGAAAAEFAARAERAFITARAAYHQQPTNVAAALRFARAAFDHAEYASDDDEREEIAETGIAVARAAISREPTNAAAHYWLGMNYGQLARTKSLGALRLVRDMEDEFQRARSLDEHVDYAGPDRSLGLLYRDTPGWPTSIGNKKKARAHLDRAAALAPEFPDNQLALLESFEKWGDKPAFDRQMQHTRRILEKARTQFTGPEWEPSWADWEKRFRAMQAKAVGRPVRSKGAK